MSEGTAQGPEGRKARGAVGPVSIRGRLVAGVLIVIPLAVTGILLRFVYGVALIVGATLANYGWWAYLWATAMDEKLEEAARLSGSGETGKLLVNPEDPTWYEVTIAIGLTVLLLYLLGWLGSNVVGRRLIDAVEGLFERIPLVDTVYGAMKRMVQALSGIGKADEEAKRVVLVDFPHENMKAIAFMTNTLVDLTTSRKMATVYVPTTPNPTSGYMEIVPVERITMTDWTMDEALSMILSGGATAPPDVRLDPGFGGTPPTGGGPAATGPPS